MQSLFILKKIISFIFRQFFDSFVKALQAFDEESYPPVADFSIPPYFFR